MNKNQKKALYESIMKSVAKTVKKALNENNYIMSREEFKHIAPNFWRAISQFCRDNNTEEGVEELIAAYTANPEIYDNMEKVFNRKQYQDFEENYLINVSDEEYEKVLNLCNF